MARSKKGDFGNESGKVGTVVKYKLNGQWVVRSVPNRTAPPTKNELINRSAFKLLSQFLSSTQAFCDAGFDVVAKGTTSSPYNKAVQYNKAAIIKDGSGVYIDFSKVLFTKGKMPALIDAAVKVSSAGIELEWDTSMVNKMRSDDQVMVMVYMAKIKRCIVTVAGASRHLGKEVLALPKSIRKYSAHVYISFVSNNRKSISDSTYLGEFSLAAG